MLRADILRPGEVCYRPCNAKDAVIAAGGQPHAVKRGAHKLLPGRVKAAHLVQPAAADVRVAHCPVSAEASALNGSRRVDALFYLARALRAASAAKLLIVQRRDLDNKVYSIQQRA